MKHRRYVILITGLIGIAAATTVAIVNLFKITIWHKYINV